MNSYKYIYLSVVIVLFAGCQAGHPPAKSNMSSVNTNNWPKYDLADYKISFRHPPEAEIGEALSILFGDTTADGRLKSPTEIGLRPEYSRRLISGVFYNFPIRFMMITEKARLDPFYAKRHHWTERPTTDLYPFDYQRHKEALLNAVEKLYLLAPIKWQEVKPATVDSKPALWMSGWDERLKTMKYFHEIVAVPIATNKILLVQAGYFQVPSSKKLEAERDIFTNVVNSIKILK